MKVKEQSINFWSFKDIFISIAYLVCWMIIARGIMLFLCWDCNEISFSIINQIILMIMTFGLIYYFAIKKANNTLKNFIGTQAKPIKVVLSALLATLLMIASTAIVEWSTLLTTAKEMPDVYQELGKSSFMLFSSFAILISPFTEEFFFRGYFQPLAVKKTGAYAGVALTAIIFSLVHTQYLFHISTFIGILSIGLILGILRHKTNSLIPCILAHLLNNIMAVAVLLK